MNDVSIEIIRALALIIVLLIIIKHGQTSRVDSRPGWYALVAGFALLAFGSLIDITDNYPSLNSFVVIGDTPLQAMLEKVFGYLLGTMLLMFGFIRWIPAVEALEESEAKLQKINAELEMRVTERTEELTVALEKSKTAELNQQKLNLDLQNKLSEIKTLSGLLPICSYCKNIRDDEGYWKQVEEYFEQNTDAEFSHGICPDCMGRAYAEAGLEPPGTS